MTPLNLSGLELSTFYQWTKSQETDDMFFSYGFKCIVKLDIAGENSAIDFNIVFDYLHNSGSSNSFLSSDTMSLYLQLNVPVVRMNSVKKLGKNKNNEKKKKVVRYSIAVSPEDVEVHPSDSFTLYIVFSSTDTALDNINIKIEGELTDYLTPNHLDNRIELIKNFYTNEYQDKIIKTFHISENTPPGEYLITFRVKDSKSVVRITVSDEKPLFWPSKKFCYISSYFGWRTLGIKRQFHKGIDIPMPVGSEVLAAADGKVVYTGWKDGWGNAILIDHFNGLKTFYAHLNDFNVDEGDFVEKGDVIGYSGDTGLVTGPHLHFGVMKHGKFVDPLKYVKRHCE